MYKNKNALITGGGGLLGPEHAIALSDLGFNIVLLDIDPVNLNKKCKLLKKKNKK